ncbi:NAD(P)/FAD-dependent oxidoreductase [Pseudonocardia endophytica]|uniref:Pyridine nucleotide-disulfide oxidoreductase n=1 Tax=Pseudonocardia endophytica TaxID=401976 RepID=A0A4R1HN13_PSEEN|nr:FAD-dependent oxidoreductase [Pseudonocardia endophytica]TCK21965.1 pyridine nucleotide-disulfide oxidoreductase [Pseudonocardia endophytica]
MRRRPNRIVVVGASLAGTTVVDTLRRHGYTGSLTLIGAESHPAYNRPALSKGVLAGDEDVALPPLSCEVDERIGTAAVGLDPDRREVVLDGGERVGYDGLAVTTGARARRLADLGAAEDGVREMTFRDLDDARLLFGLLATRPHIVIVGAGILGMELASASVDRGATVTVVDRQPPLRSQLGPHLAGLLTRAAQRRQVRFAHHRGGVRLLRSSGPPVVELADGRRFEGDHVLSAVGCAAETGWLAGSGLDGERGLTVDSRCRVRQDIVAAGDVAAFPSADGPRRTPWWTSALEQARTAAMALLDGDDTPPLVPSPYFWTDQFGVRVRVCGALPADGEPAVARDDPPSDGVLLRWPGTAAAVNKRIPIGRLRALTEPTTTSTETQR